MIYLNDIPLDTFMKYYDTEKNSEHNYTPLTEDLIPDDLKEYYETDEHGNDTTLLLSPINISNLDVMYQNAFKKYFNVDLSITKKYPSDGTKNTNIVYAFPLIYDDSSTDYQEVENPSAENISEYYEYASDGFIKSTEFTEGKTYYTYFKRNTVVLSKGNEYIDDELTAFNFTSVNMISQLSGTYTHEEGDTKIDTTKNTGIICYKYTFETKRSDGTIEKPANISIVHSFDENDDYNNYNYYVEHTVTRETFASEKAHLYYKSGSDITAVQGDDNYNSTIIYYINSNKSLSYTPTTLFSPFNAYYTIIYDENINNPICIYFFIKGVKQTMPKRSNNGSVIYRDSSGLLTTEPKYTNNFYRHQNAIRKSFFGLTKDSGWMYKIKPDQICLLQKGSTYQVAFHKDYTKTTVYEYSETSEGNGNEEIINVNRDMINIADATDNDKKTTVETIKTPFYINYLSDFTTYKAYTSSYDESYYRVPAITNIIPNDSNNAVYDRVYGNVNIYKRSIQFVNASDDSYSMEVSNNDTIRYYATISNNSNSVLRTIDSYEGTVFEINSNEPYLLIPLLVGTKELLSRLNNQHIILSNIDGASKLNGKLSVDPLDTSTVSITFDNRDAEILLDKEDLNDLEKACVESILSKVGSNKKSLEEMCYKIFFIKVPLSTLKETFIETRIADIRSVKKKEISNTDSQSEIISPVTNLVKHAITFLIKFSMNIAQISTNKLLGLVEDTNYSVTAKAIDNKDYYKNKFELKSLSDRYFKDIQNEIKNISISNLYENYGSTDVTYYSNPWSSVRPYVKKTVSYSLVTNSDDNNLNLINLDSAPMVNSDIINYFSNNNILADDGMASMRGSAIPEEVFVDKRKSALSSSLTELFKLSDDNDAESLFFNVSGGTNKGIKKVINDSDGIDKVYNYCKGINSLVKNGIRNFSADIVTERDLVDPSDFYYNIILYDTSYEGSPEISELPTIQTLYNSGNTGITASQDILTGLKVADKYPIKQKYLEYQSALMAASTDVSAITIDININIKKTIKDTSKAYDYSADLLNKISSSLAKVYATGNTSLLLLTEITESKLDKLTSNKSYGKTNASTYKKVYSSLSKVDKNQNKDDNNYIKYIDDILYEIIFNGMEVYNE